ncbi:MAG: iron-containing alcohol dehydrogenase [Phycisphaerae bacterium]|jgi:alcohol dehydrogenase
MTPNLTPDTSPPRHPRCDYRLPEILRRSRTRVTFGPGTIATLGKLAKNEGATNVLLVTDPGIRAAGHAERAAAALRDAQLPVTVFDGVEENPTTEHVAAGIRVARRVEPDFLVGLGGGSAMDCAKGINFILTNGGKMADYWGVNKATKPMLPMIAVPTTAGTGSEAQCFALITDPVTRRKMACGDVKAQCRAAVLDPELTRTVPFAVAAATGIDAIAHAVETAATTKRNEDSLAFTREAWTRLDRALARVMQNRPDEQARADMTLGAHLAGAAIEHSMLGAAHACANPLTARFKTLHGSAVGLMLPHVVRFNAADSKLGNPYTAICDDAEDLAQRIEWFLGVAGLPRQLRECQVPVDALPDLAHEAANEWTAGFNPRPVGEPEFLTIYRAAYA